MIVFIVDAKGGPMSLRSKGTAGDKPCIASVLLKLESTPLEESMRVPSRSKMTALKRRGMSVLPKLHFVVEIHALLFHDKRSL